MINEEAVLREVFVGLLSLGEYSFPRECSKCGRVYSNLSELLRESKEAMQSSGLLESDPPDPLNPVVGVFRNCVCGNGLTVVFKDRRDQSNEGLRRRESFGQLLEKLKVAGVDTEVARGELIKLLRGQRSDILNRLIRPPGT